MHSQALRQIAAHRTRGDYLVLMSASPDLYVPAVARALGFNETICTAVRWDGMILNGELLTPNRRGDEKLQCVLALRRRHTDVPITAYANSASDLAHLGACEHPYLVQGDPNAVLEAAGSEFRLAGRWKMSPHARQPRRNRGTEHSASHSKVTLGIVFRLLIYKHL